MDNIIDKTKKWVIDIYPNAAHLIRTIEWVSVLYPDADTPLLIAALTHDIERAFKNDRNPPSPESKNAKWDDVVYNKWHGERLAKIVKEYLAREGIQESVIGKVGQLIERHEVGGNPEADILMDADSISFLENNVEMFISWIPEKNTKNEIEAKFDYMYNRIVSQKAKIIAKPFFEKAISALSKI